MNENKPKTANQSSQAQVVSIPVQELVNIYNLLFSIEVKGESVKALAFAEQTIENYLKIKPTNDGVNEIGNA